MNKLLRSALLVLTTVLFSSSMLLAQTVHYVAAGDTTLRDAYNAAASGDILELTTDGGVYINPSITIEKDITIRAAEGLFDKPVLKNSSGGSQFFKITTTASLTLKGLDLDGDGTDIGASSISKYSIIIDTDDNTLAPITLKIDDCVIHESSDKLIKLYGLSVVDSVIITNSTFYNGSKEGVCLYEGSSSAPAAELGYAEITNCTFYNMGREAIKLQSWAAAKMLVDHVTMYNISGDPAGQQKSFIYVDAATDVTIKNSIFQKNYEVGNWIRLESSDNVVNNCIFFDVNDHDIDNSDSVTDTLYADPLFVDPANADFTLGDGSPALAFADDGSVAGDVRWDPNYVPGQTIRYVAAGDSTLRDALVAAADGDILELTSSGGVYVNPAITLDKSITIRAAEGLIAKPVLKVTDGSQFFKLTTPVDFTLQGLDLDGDATDLGASSILKYSIIVDTDDNTLAPITLKIDNCNIHESTDKLIKLYGLSVVDTVMISNSKFFNGGKEGVCLYEGSSSAPPAELGYAEITNCTFYNMGREAIKLQSWAAAKMLVDHVTMYNISGDPAGQQKSFIYVDAATDVTIKNSIFQKNYEVGNWMRLESSDNVVNNCIFFDVNDHDIDNSDSVTDTLYADPLFVDPANADFTLGSGSPALSFADDGKDAGDLNWAGVEGKFRLTLLANGSGNIVADPAGPYYDPGTVVTLTAVPEQDWQFVGWDGVLVFPPDNPVATVTMDADKQVTANFELALARFVLDVSTVGVGHVEFSPGPVDSSKWEYYEGTEVTMTAVADSASMAFSEWTGDVTGNTNPAVLTIDGDKSITAVFAPTVTQYTLNVDTVGLGNVMLDPQPYADYGTYDEGTVVTMTAEALMGFEFSAWSGDVTASTPSTNVTMDGNKNVTATFTEINVPGGILEIDSTWSLYDAVQFANNNSTVHTLKLTTEGVYTSHSTSTVSIMKPLTIMAAEGLPSKPIITNTDPDGVNGEIDILRVYDSITLDGVEINGSTDYSAGMKYGVRFANGTDTVKWGADAIFNNVTFQHLYDDGKPTGDGHAFKLDREIILGTVKFENCFFNDIGYEAIRISDTEKWVTDRCFDSLVVRNCTFTNIDAEGIRYYSDLDGSTVDAPVLVEHVTFDNSATRTMYLKNSGGAIVRDIIVSNPRQSGHGRDGEVFEIQGNPPYDCFVSHIDTFNVGGVGLAVTDGQKDEATLYGYDPMYEDAANFDWTLKEGSMLYGLGHDGKAIGDLNWATNAVGIESEKGVPTVYALQQNYPNPFNPSTTIRFDLKEAGLTTLKIYNVLGQEVLTLVNSKMAAGTHTVTLHNPSIPSGVYFYKLQSGNFTSIKKMMLVK